MSGPVPIQSECIACYHCGLPSQPVFATEINGELQNFCCAGCAAVAGSIQQSGLEIFINIEINCLWRPPTSKLRI
ncbi:MAG: heavy metal translocating P-type ATPase metal-binding domain-containing protein [Porticoccaceae bacterium]